MRYACLVSLALSACTPTEPPEPAVSVPEESPPLPTPGSFEGLLTTQTSISGDAQAGSIEVPLVVALDHRADGREVVRIQTGPEAFSLELESDCLFVVRGGWRVEATAGGQTAIRGEESEDATVRVVDESGCDRIEISREWSAVSPLHATSESLSFVLCANGEILEVAADTTFPLGRRSLVWSSAG